MLKLLKFGKIFHAWYEICIYQTKTLQLQSALLFAFCFIALNIKHEFKIPRGHTQ